MSGDRAKGAPEVRADGQQDGKDVERLQLLADGSKLFAEGGLEPEAIMTALAALVVPRVARVCVIRLLSEDRRLFHTAAAREADPALQGLLADASAKAVTADSKTGGVLLSGKPILLPTVDPALMRANTDESQWPYLDAAPPTTLLMVPMRSRGEIVGVLSAYRSEPAPPFDTHDQIVLQELADRAAMHWRKARLFAAERRARENAERLQTVTADLASARTTREVADVIMKRGRDATGAFGAMIFGIDRQQGQAVVIARQGYDPERIQAYDRIPLHAPMPLAECLRSGHTFYFENRDQMIVRYPVIAEGIARAASNGMAFLPLTSQGVVSGALVLSFSEAHAFAADDRAFLEALANQAALALDRARLSEVERGARERASFLAEASRLLTSSLDYQTILRRLAELAVPILADWAAVEMIEDGEPRQLAVSPAAPRPDGSSITVPITAHGRTLGALSLVSTAGGRTYGDDDLELALDLGGRAGMAVENARLYADLRSAVQAREDFLAIAGHELRTPLFALLMQVQGAERAARKDPALGRIAERLVKASASGARLEKLVGQLLDVSRLAGGFLGLEPEPLDAGDLVREVVARFADEAETAGCALRLSAPSGVIGRWDRLRLEQVISNLVSNALKYGRGKPVDVQLDRDGDTAVLRVTDRGIGLSDETKARLFGKFERALAARNFGGMGLGLWIIKQIVDACGGTIEASGAAGAGATFVVRLPIEPPPLRTRPSA